MKRAIILAGGQITPTPELIRLCARWRKTGAPDPDAPDNDTPVIAADAGLHHAKVLGLTPRVVVGDFDSVDPAILAAYPELPRAPHPVRKDELDLELALCTALEKGARELLVVGALGGRLDQSLAALLIALRLRQTGTRVTLHSGHTLALPLRAGETFMRQADKRRNTFSLFSMTPESSVTLVGASFPGDIALAFGSGYGVSNQTTADDLHISVARGEILVLFELLKT